MDLPKRKVLIKAFITPPFRFCSLIWMLHSRSLSNRFNDIQEKALRLAYKDKPELLEKGHSVTVLFNILTRFSHRNL